MKNVTLFSIFLVVSAAAYSQDWNELQDEDHPGNRVERTRGPKHDCGTRVELADSVINFGYNNATGEFYPVEVRKYSYDSRDNLTVIHLISLPERANVLRQVFEYDNDDNQTGFTNYNWVNGAWEKSLYVTRSFTPEGNIHTEVYHNRDAAGSFRPYMQHFYEYDGARPVRYLRQVLNAQGLFYDFSYHNYVYDSQGRLEVLYGQYINGPVFWERTSVYDGNLSRAAQRYLRQLKYDPVLKQNVLTNITFEDYSYNIYGNVSEILYHGWTNNEWAVNGKAVYYYSLLHGRKVSICHNGITLCVSVNAVKAHLEHGDKLGPCDFNTVSPPGRGNEKPNNTNLQFSLYPNPAGEVVTIKLPPGENPFTDGYLIHPSGRVLKTFRVTGMEEITISLGGIKPGNYVVRLNHPAGSTTKTLIKK